MKTDTRWKTSSLKPAMTFRQIAIAMGIDESTVRELYDSAVRKLTKDPRAYEIFVKYVTKDE